MQIGSLSVLLFARGGIKRINFLATSFSASAYFSEPAKVKDDM
jgi:hypothetical protein